EPSAGVPAPAPPAAPPARTPDPRWTTPSGEPRYGAMRPSSDQPTDAPAPDAGPGSAPAPGAHPDQPERPA
ncbi:MAG: general stress protein, partial [Cellulosimicrobium funkei]